MNADERRFEKSLIGVDLRLSAAISFATALPSVANQNRMRP
jgi:hypothetical protein